MPSMIYFVFSDGLYFPSDESALCGGGTVLGIDDAVGEKIDHVDRQSRSRLFIDTHGDVLLIRRIARGGFNPSMPKREGWPKERSTV